MPPTAPPDTRTPPPMTGPERVALRGWLDYHRATLAWKVDGLDDDALRRRAVPPSTLSLLGLVRHMAEVERHWFRRVVAAEEVRHVWSSSWDFQAAFEVDDASGAEAVAAWSAECERAGQIEASVKTLDTTFDVPAWNSDATLRALLLHMIHEYARHNGQADLLREAVDGVTGA